MGSSFREAQGAMTHFEPAYIRLLRSGELAERADRAWRHLVDCDLCARYCRVNRLETTKGAVCRTGEQALVSSYGTHFGEEAPLTGRRGSGTIFFCWCNLRCVFCQNWEISQKGVGRAVEPEEIAAMMLNLQREGCHNINFVTPSHAVAQILSAVLIAARRELRLPLVYNTGGYDSPEVLALLDGVIDIYMPDMKYGDSEKARKYSKVRDYAGVSRAAVREMHRQVGDLILNKNGVAQRGLLVRHLVLPGDISGTEAILAFIANEISTDTYLNLMDQYRPCHHASEYPPLNRPLLSGEYESAMELAKRYGLRRLVQGRQMRWSIL